MTVFQFALIKGLRNPGTFIFNCVLPIALILIRPLWTGEIFLSGVGLLIMVIWGGSFLMAQGIVDDRESGSLIRILAAPVSMLNYLTQNLMAFMVPLTAQAVLVTVLGMVLYDWNISFALTLFLCITVFTASAVAMSFAWYCLFKSKESSFSSFSAVVTFGSFLSGVFIPLTLFPEALQHVGAVLPAYWAMRALDHLFENGSVTGYLWQGIAAMVIFTAIFLLFGGKRRLV
jgi:ABC-2 type transport system permease protein